jgi:non-ribosomal peptide synthetase-like protein
VLEVRAGLEGDTVLGTDACLRALSSLPRGAEIPSGECWYGIPAIRQGPALPAPPLPLEDRLTPLGFGWRLLLARLGLGALLALPADLLFIGLAVTQGWDRVFLLEGFTALSLGATLLILVLSVPLTLALQALTMRALGPIHPGILGRWSRAYIRVWLKTGQVDAAGEWLSGTLFWPLWLRLAGMRLGPGCEISTILDVVPELVEVGAETFFADGIYLGGPRVQRGTVTLATTRLGRNTFLGNHAVILAGQTLPDDILLGVCTVADASRIQAGTSWFGHPPFELPHREIVACDRSLTHQPSPVRYLNRLFWEALRFTLPVFPLLVFIAWAELAAWSEATLSHGRFFGVALPLVTLGSTLVFALVILLLKWGLLGRVRPGTHPLWSCWCSRWDFLYVAWGMYARGLLTQLEGTLWLTWYLRTMGMQIGHGAVLGPGFTQVVDPDMIHIGDGATVQAMFQAHTFEDRVLKIDHVHIEAGATLGHGTVPLYGAVIGARTSVAPHSVIMKRERLLPDSVYEGAPTQRVEGAGEGLS